MRLSERGDISNDDNNTACLLPELLVDLGEEHDREVEEEAEDV